MSAVVLSAEQLHCFFMGRGVLHRFWNSSLGRDELTRQLPLNNVNTVTRPQIPRWPGGRVSGRGGPTQCLDLALVTLGKWSEPLFCLFRGPPGHSGPGSPNKNITRVDVRVGRFFRCLSFQERAVCAVPLALSAWPDLRPRIM